MGNRCIFCEIVKQGRPASMVWQDAACSSFLDIHPITRGHVLVIPQAHVGRLVDLEAEDRAHLFAVSNRILQALYTCGLARDGANILVNDGQAANQHIPHVHIHLIPRSKGDTPKVAGLLVARMFNQFGRAAPRGQLDAVAAKIRQALANSFIAKQ
jgi:histidine triad (HIT) family protein